ncbi:L,D-transpeptidase [Mycoplasma sp. P36-A1]|uniref:L,D-transpeptidase n=1 Tax=Mycoplasma sp. P36-A1 TaxID=3252900 RepID=UPI003C2E15C7
MKKNTVRGLVALVLVMMVSLLSVNAIKMEKEYTDYRTRAIVKHKTTTNINNRTITVKPKSSYNLDVIIGRSVTKAKFKTSNKHIATVNANSGLVKFTKKTGIVTITAVSSENKTYKVKFRVGETYAKINISKQSAYLYVNGKLARTAKVVTGTKNKHDTPKGTWYVAYKTRNTYLDGASVGYDYYLPVKYWIPLANTGGVGLHDARWRSNSAFGKSYYKTEGSHGCINMRNKDVAYFYKYLKAGSRVVIV